MPKGSYTNIPSSFISDLKLGDNICFNLNAIGEQYAKQNFLAGTSRKPVIILNTSVIEALMIDFIRRVKRQHREFQYLDESKRKAIRNLKSDSAHWKFKESINKFAHHQLVGNVSNFYDAVHYLREVRNHIHIHVTVISRNECEIWTQEVLTASEKCLEFIAKFLSINYPRPLEKDFVGGLQLPWEPHFADSSGKLKWKKVKSGDMYRASFG